LTGRVEQFGEVWTTTLVDQLHPAGSAGSSVARTGEVVELAKTSASRRQVPLAPRAGAVLDRPPLRLDTPRLFPAPAGGLLNLQELADSAEQATAVPD
jgi:hypothetical protein